MRLDLAYLKRTHPAWKWSAVRDGFGWRYEGVKTSTGARVELRCYSVHVGDDRYEPRWMTSEGNAYAFWAMLRS